MTKEDDPEISFRVNENFEYMFDKSLPGSTIGFHKISNYSSRPAH